ncbi:IAA-alanine resistance protein 1 isoform X1 [Amborella trichopoda]|uniref:IAA-alanine resistance protein 1 n=1 Tax=Amborella trichopoda TaxID=13333 RepID=W1PTK3_AMBTC|nr:IAA-alanine resistance protein 1 isoform X1 [Amborella trichopoda]ERN11036.1 hypothetical protein AMTR_s00024p00076160 [Amborella trichopoda]|eukprot:XP_006849455.1 IAA-alanine resistance protein 1 isoform X1 [Amborella trichopoda]
MAPVRASIVAFMVLILVGPCISHGFDGHGHHHDHHGCHHHHHDHSHDHHHDHRNDDHHVNDHKSLPERKLPEELAEEEDLKLYGFGLHSSHGEDHSHSVLHLSKLGLWVHAMGCSLLVSMASLICLIILPVFFLQGKPSEIIVDSLAAFGAGAMLGDSFLHQLPHALGGNGHSHSPDQHMDHGHNHGRKESHSHSLNDLSVGLSVLSGIVVFLLVEMVVRYVEDHSGKGAHVHHHHRKSNSKSKIDEDHNTGINSGPSDKEETFNGKVDDCQKDKNQTTHEAHLRKRGTSTGAGGDKKEETNNLAIPDKKTVPVSRKEVATPSSNIVFGYLNLFSDGVHNFTDGMALGSAFLLYGSVGGWSRTLFLLAHELPQEIGDFGILVRSGFTVFEALFFNFLSALVALAGTALALLLGQDPGHSSLIEGFTAGGFIYIAVAGVLPEMNKGNSTVIGTIVQLSFLIMGMAVALCISLLE